MSLHNPHNRISGYFTDTELARWFDASTADLPSLHRSSLPARAEHRLHALADRARRALLQRLESNESGAFSYQVFGAVSSALQQGQPWSFQEFLLRQIEDPAESYVTKARFARSLSPRVDPVHHERIARLIVSDKVIPECKEALAKSLYGLESAQAIRIVLSPFGFGQGIARAWRGIRNSHFVPKAHDLMHNTVEALEGSTHPVAQKFLAKHLDSLTLSSRLKALETLTATKHPSARESILAQLGRHPSDYFANEEARLFRVYRDDQTVATLKGLLGSEDLKTQMWALCALKGVVDPEVSAVARRIALDRNRDLGVRNRAVEFFEGREDDVAVSTLLSLVTGEDPDFTTMAGIFLEPVILRDVNALHYLVERLRSTRGETRSAIGRALCGVTDESVLRKIQLLLEAAPDDPLAVIAGSLISASRNEGILLEEAGHIGGAAKERAINAMHALYASDLPQVVSSLARAVCNEAEDPELRARAVGALPNLVPEVVSFALMQTFATTPRRKNQELVEELIPRMTGVLSRQATDRLYRYARRNDGLLSDLAVSTLLRRRDPAGIDDAIKKLGRQMYDAEAIRALGKSFPEGATDLSIELLCQALEVEDPAVAMSAAQTLGGLLRYVGDLPVLYEG